MAPSAWTSEKWVQTLLCEELTGKVREVGRHAQVAVPVFAKVLRDIDQIGHALHINPGGRHSKLQLAVTIAQLFVQDEQVLTPQFEHQIISDDAQLSGAIRDLGDYILHPLK